MFFAHVFAGSKHLYPLPILLLLLNISIVFNWMGLRLVTNISGIDVNLAPCRGISREA
jgi:hypothetical protein